MPPTATSPTTTAGAADGSWPRWLPASILATLVYVTFEPFGGGEAVKGGNVVNQIGFLLIGTVCLRLVVLMEPRARAALLQPAWIAIGLALLFAVSQADDPNASLRAAAFSAIVVLAAGTVVAWPASLSELTGTLTATALVAIAFSLVAVWFYPGVGVHDGSGYEWQHEGLWRGTFAHKNVASYVAGAFVIVGLFVAANGRPGWGWLTVALALWFTVEAGSKTVLGVLPVAISAGWLASRFRNGVLRALIVVLPVAALAAVTLGAALSEPLNELLRSVAPGTTFTGRLDLWKFTAEQIAKAPHAGYGFESFWTTPRVTGLEQPIELSWDVREIVHGHNSYLDAVIAFGGWGAAVVFFVVLVRPVWHFANLPRRGDGAAAAPAQLWIQLWLLCAMGASLESFFLRRSDPVWFTMALAVFGLQIAYARTRRRSDRIASTLSSSTTTSARE